jgi:hypothetical protein
MGERFATRAPASDPALAITERLVKPGIAIREQMAERFRKLAVPAEGRELYLAYVELFDPIDSIARERLRAGERHDDGPAKDLEKLMFELGDEQKAAAQRAGLQECAQDFFTAAFGTGSSG